MSLVFSECQLCKNPVLIINKFMISADLVEVSCTFWAPLLFIFVTQLFFALGTLLGYFLLQSTGFPYPVVWYAMLPMSERPMCLCASRSDLRTRRLLSLASLPMPKSAGAHNELRALDEQGPRISQPVRHLSQYLAELCCPDHPKSLYRPSHSHWSLGMLLREELEQLQMKWNANGLEVDHGAETSESPASLSSQTPVHHLHEILTFCQHAFSSTRVFRGDGRLVNILRFSEYKRSESPLSGGTSGVQWRQGAVSYSWTTLSARGQGRHWRRSLKTKRLD